MRVPFSMTGFPVTGTSSGIQGLVRRASGSRMVQGAALGMGGAATGMMMMHHRRNRNMRYPVR